MPYARSLLILVVALLAFAPAAGAVDCPGASPCPYTGTASVGAHGTDRLSGPYDVAIDGSGNVYVASERPTVDVYDSSGTFLRRFGGDASGNGGFSFPTGIALGGPDGDLYTADPNSNRVMEFRPDGRFVAKWGGNQGNGNTQFGLPYDVVADATGNVYVADYVNNRVVKRAPDGSFLWATTVTSPRVVALDEGGGTLYAAPAFGSAIQVLNASSGALGTPIGAQPANFNNPLPGEWNSVSGLSVDPLGTLYIHGDGRIDSYSAGAFAHVVGAGVPSGQIAARGGNVFVSVVQGDAVLRYSTTTGLLTARIGAPRPGELLGPRGSGVDSAGNLWVADTDLNRIQKFAPDGTYLAAYGANSGDGTAGAGDGEFRQPIGVAIDSADNVWVADWDNNRVVKLNASGAFVQKWTLSTGRPDAIAVSPSGSVFVSFLDDHTVRSYTLADNGTQAPLQTFGTSGNDGTGDGLLGWPRGIAVDASSLYVADNYYQAGHERVQKFDASTGAFQAKWGSAGNGDGQFEDLRGIALDGTSVYTVDSFTYHVQKFTTAGVFEARWGQSAGGGEPCPGQFGFLEGVSARNGIVYASDSQTHRVERFQFSGGTIGGCPGFDAAVALTSPIGGGTIAGDATITGTASTAAGAADAVTVRVYRLPAGTNFERTYETLSATVAGDGTWSVPLSPVLPAGSFQIEAAQDDLAGHLVMTTRRNVTVGSGGGGPAITINPTSHDFGDVVVGQKSATQTFTVTNTGTADLTISALSIYVPFEPTSGQTCGAITLHAGEHCDIPIRFAPGGEGSVSGTHLILTTNAPTSPTNVALSGRGVPAPVTADTTTPTVAITSIADNSLQNQRRPVFTGTSSDDAGDDATVTVEVQRKQPDGTYARVKDLSAPRTGTTWTVTYPEDLPDGHYFARAYLSDNAGHGATFPIQWDLDATAPRVEVTTPAAGDSVEQGKVGISGFAGALPGDAATVRLVIFQGSTAFEKVAAVVTRSGTKWSTSLDLSKLPEGKYGIRVDQLDAAGNDGYYQAVLLITKPLVGAYRVTGIEPVQVVQNVFPAVTIGRGVSYDGVKMVEGRRMFVRVYVTASPSIPVKVTLKVTRSGGGSYSVPGPIKTAGIKTLAGVATEKQADQDGAFVFDVPGSEVRGGPLTLEADVTPSVKASCAAGETCGGTKLTGVTLQKTKSFAIHTIELTRGGKRPSSPDAPLAVAQRLLPLSDATPFTYTSQGTSIEVGPLFTNQVCANDATGRLVCRAPTRLEILTRLYNAVMDSELDDTDPKDISLGLVNGTSSESLGMGSTFFGSQDAVKFCGLSTKGRRNTTCHPASMVDPQRRYMTLVSHEMFHNFKLQHASAACGGGTSAADWPPDQQGYLQGYGFDPSRTSATGNSSGDNPFLVGPQGPVGAGGALGPLFDLMAYCAPNDDNGERYSWISPRNYLGAMTTLSGGATASAAHADPPARGAREQEGRRRLARAAQAGGSGLYVSGFVSPTDASAELGSVRPTTPGAVTARALRSQLGSTSLVNLQTVDAAGKVVAETSMTPLEVHGDGTTAAQPVQMLRALVPSAGIDELRLVVPKTGIVLGSRKRSPNAPTVALKGLRKGQLLKGAPKLKVAAADKDGGALTLTTQVSVDGGKRWRTVASGPKAAKIKLARGALPATNNGRIRVLANDGWNETVALSPRLRFAGEPPQVRLTSPAKPYRLIAGRPLSLVASAIDENGKRLTGNKLTWRIDGKVVGRGPSVTVKKRPKTGRRKVVLTAVDGKHRTTTVKFVLKVDKPKK